MGKTLVVLLGTVASVLPFFAQPVITNQPASQFVIYGGNATFSVMVTGVGPFTYQWQMNGTNLPNNIISTFAGTYVSGFSGDGGAATNARLTNPSGVAVDSYGNVLFADTGNSRIRRVDTNGIITTVAGTNAAGFAGDGGFANLAKLNGPYGVALDAGGNYFIADAGNSRIRKVDTNGIITTVAGNGTAGYGGDGAAATNAPINAPHGVAVDGVGNLFIADTSNNRIRMVDTNGNITTLAGTNSAGGTGDGGPATNAMLNSPQGVAVDGAGNIFIADCNNRRIRRINATGIITTFAGTNVSGFSGDGGPATNARLTLPAGVAVDSYGYVFIADSVNNRIRQVDPNGIITTVAGNGSTSFSGDGGAATNAGLGPAFGMATEPDGSLLIAATTQFRIRRATLGRIPTLSINGVTTNNAGTNYQVIVTSPSGSVTSSVAGVSLQLPPITPAYTASNGVYAFTWNAIPGQAYQLQSATNLAAPAWADLGSPVTATSNTVFATDVLGADGQRFYRVRLWP